MRWLQPTDYYKTGKELTLLLQILKGSEDASIEVHPEDAKELIRLASMHRVTYSLYLFAQKNTNAFASGHLELLEKRCRQNARRSLVQLSELIRLAGKLNEAKIEFACIKGPQLSRMLYGTEALKESVDLDILLTHRADLHAVHVMFRESGYSRSNLNNYPGRLSQKVFLTGKREIQYFNPTNRCQIDLHIRAGANTYLTAGLFGHFLEGLVKYDLEGTKVPVLSNEKYLAYLCYHGALHMFSRLGWLMDIRTMLVVKRNELDTDKVLAMATEINAKTSLLLAMALLKDYFGDEIPSPLEKEIIRNIRFEFLVNSCRKMLSKDAGYGITLKGRTGKLIYMMALIKGMAGRIDLLFGIFVRALIHRHSKK